MVNYLLSVPFDNSNKLSNINSDPIDFGLMCNNPSIFRKIWKLKKNEI